VVFAEHGDNDDGNRVAEVSRRNLRFAQRFDDFLDAAAEGFGLGSCVVLGLVARTAGNRRK
jgi:hypothetical protein